MERECARMASADGTTDFYEAVRYIAGITFPSTVVVCILPLFSLCLFCDPEP